MTQAETVAGRINQIFEKLEASLSKDKQITAQRFIHPLAESTDVTGFSEALSASIMGMRGYHQLAAEVITHPEGFPIALIVTSKEAINIIFPSTDYDFDNPQPNLTFIQLSPRTQ